jgi:hypothetical protein
MTAKVRMITDISETTPFRREWSDIFQVIKGKCQPRILYPVKLSFIPKLSVKQRPFRQIKAERLHL